MRAVLGLFVLVLALPSAAGAATVRVEFGQLFFSAAPGERNDVTIDRNTGTITDTGTPPDPGTGCRSTDDPARVGCNFSFQGLVSLGDGDDRLLFSPSGGSSGYDVTGGDGADTVAGTWVVRRIDGGPGPDTLSTGEIGLGFSTELIGGDGDDELTSTGIGPADGGPGHDTITAPGGAQGGDGDDRITVKGIPGFGPTGYAPPPAAVAGGSCVPFFPGPGGTNGDGGPGNDTIIGSELPETLTGGAGNDRLEGADGADRIAGDAGDDSLEGGGGVDDLAGGEGADTLSGGEDGDRLDGGPGADTSSGGGGSDEVCYAGRAGPVTVDMSRPGGDGEAGENDSIGDDVESIGGTSRDDTFVAGDGPLIASGGAGDDTIRGGPAGDWLDGGPGDDTIAGAGGDDRLAGGEMRRTDGAGDDKIEGGPGDDFMAGGYGDDWLSGGPGRDALSGLERFGLVSGPIGAMPGGGAINHSPIVSMAHEDQLWCGADVDRVSAEFADAVAADCEEASEGAVQWKRRSLTGSGRIQLKARCAWDSGRACKGTIRVLAAVRDRAGTVPASPSSAFGAGTPAWCKPLTRRVPALSRVRFDVRAGRVGALEAQLTRKGRALVARRGCVPVRVALEFRDGDGRAYGSSRAISLTRRGFRP